MTTSKALHDHLVNLSQKARRSRKSQTNSKSASYRRVDAGRIVELTKVVLHSARGTTHHRTAPAAAAAAVEETTNNKSGQPQLKKTAAKRGQQQQEGVALAKPTRRKKDDHQQDGDDCRDTYYPQLHQQLKQELKDMEETKLRTRQNQVQMWNLYKYALEKVSKLNDLRDAPDAILPGNFPGDNNSNTTTTTTKDRDDNNNKNKNKSNKDKVQGNKKESKTSANKDESSSREARI